ncbi:response regulator [Devosia rhizoryzae]|uniref:Response regulator n=1 Tax=Devosia rhizoryzae TaxID=2774137 RepID=A0ABX7C7M9_9HYPH|nr:response regulator [Devosia rhizoryzae]QQR38727.1 response regulator [Devosia rhizoryzae]
MEVSPPRGSGVTILVVDDDALITLNTVDQLAELGHLPVEAFSAAEALSILQKRDDIAALITDYSMPGMNGVQLAEAARALRPGLPILLATGYAELPEDAPTGLPRLEKPFRQEELARQIASLFGEVEGE